MFEGKAGVTKLLMDQFPLTGAQCAGFAADSVRNKSFQYFIDNLYSTQHSPLENKTELCATPRDMDVQLLSVGQLLDTRWVSSVVTVSDS